MTDMKVSKEQVSSNIQPEIKSQSSDIGENSSDFDDERADTMGDNLDVTARGFKPNLNRNHKSYEA